MPTSGSFVMLCVANYFPYKGIEDLIAAMDIIRDCLPPWQLILAGKGTEKFELSRIVGISYSTEVPKLLSIADLFILPSHEEGSSNALLEAMAAGVPVIATDVGGNSDAIQHGYTGVLVPPRRPDMLAVQIKAAALCREQFARMARMAQLDVAIRFSFDRMVDEYEALYREFA